MPARTATHDDDLQRTLLSWHDTAGRDLPWRRSGLTPWLVLVSEVALQQTQAARVAARFDALAAVMPDPASTARRPLGDVLSAWQGLGYPRRAAALHRSAAVIVADHGGRVPRDLAALTALPGVGPYTARAVQVFAFGAGAAPVDVNVGRVLARAVSGTPLTRADAQWLADAQVAPGRPAASRPAAWAGALMDLGSQICRARAPDCPSCPIGARCRWRRSGGAAGDVGDPAAATATRARPQPAWEGSDRQARGRLLAAAASGPVTHAELAAAAGCEGDAARAGRLAAALVADGLLTRSADTWHVP